MIEELKFRHELGGAIQVGALQPYQLSLNLRT